MTACPPRFTVNKWITMLVFWVVTPCTLYITSYMYRDHSGFKWRQQAALIQHRPKRPHEVKPREDYETTAVQRLARRWRQVPPEHLYIYTNPTVSHISRLYSSGHTRFSWVYAARWPYSSSQSIHFLPLVAITLSVHLLGQPWWSPILNTTTNPPVELITNHHDQSTCQVNN